MDIKESPVLFDYPNQQANTFIMMRFRNSPQQDELLAAIRESLSYCGINGLRADDKSYTSSLLANVRSYMDASAHGIVVFEQNMTTILILM